MERHAGQDLLDLLTSTCVDVGALTSFGPMLSTPYSTTYDSHTFPTGSAGSVDKDLLSLLESTGLQGGYNGEDLAYFLEMTTLIP